MTDEQTHDNFDFLPGRRHHDVGLMPSWDGLVKLPRYHAESDTFVMDHALPRDALMDTYPHAIVEEAGATFNAFTVYVQAAGTPTSGPVTLFGADPKRKKAKISNGGASAVVIGSRPQVAQGQGFILPANTIMETDVQTEVCAGIIVGYAGATIPVGVFVERN